MAKKQTTLDRLEGLFKAAPATLSTLRTHRAGLVQRIDALRRAGTVNATPHYRDGKYLYLIHPQRDGERRREYVGSEPTKVAAALGRVERFKESERLEAELSRLDRCIQSVTFDASRVECTLRELARAVH